MRGQWSPHWASYDVLWKQHTNTLSIPTHHDNARLIRSQHSQLRLNTSKTQVLRLGSKYQLLKLNIQDVPVLSTSARIVDSPRDLGVVIDSGLTMSDHITAVCRSAYYQLHQLCTIARRTFVVRRCQEDFSPVVRFLSTGLLQRPAVWHLRHSDGMTAASTKSTNVALTHYWSRWGGGRVTTTIHSRKLHRCHGRLKTWHVDDWMMLHEWMNPTTPGPPTDGWIAGEAVHCWVVDVETSRHVHHEKSLICDCRS